MLAVAINAEFEIVPLRVRTYALMETFSYCTVSLAFLHRTAQQLLYLITVTVPTPPAAFCCLLC